MEQELLSLPEHLGPPQVFSGVRVTLSLVLSVMFCRSLFVLLSFFFRLLCCLFFFDSQILNYNTPLVSSIYNTKLLGLSITFIGNFLSACNKQSFAELSHIPVSVKENH